MGSPFEGEAHIGRTHLSNYFNQILDPSIKVPFKPYTDDTAMTKQSAISLIENKSFNAQDMVKKFANEYFHNPKRGYGSAIGDIFFNLRRTNYADPYGPASMQFKGLGSYGNGAAMRVAPVALFAYHHCSDGDNHDVTPIVNLVTDASKVTHSNKLGYRGAILQALAIRLALLLDKDDFDTISFANELIQYMTQMEVGDDPDDPIDGGKSFVTKLELVKQYLNSTEEPHIEEIQNKLGVHVSALDSVPTAIYCFLAAQKPLESVPVDCKFHRCIHYAISLGGDTDTIASMAGAIIGAHMGDEVIPNQFLVHCEHSEDIRKIADDLYEASKPTKCERYSSKGS
ncbi:unnamed protein product [Allacma fusca]|uniref:ADP-ribosylhydrolase ARH3 n=1 Tax=Allacma fusca TaxID=39272 RepID=A0A8J2M0U3_9HEXA|nr:unnamed protein product [Allacma fusca]